MPRLLGKGQLGCAETIRVQDLQGLWVNPLPAGNLSREIFCGKASRLDKRAEPHRCSLDDFVTATFANIFVQLNLLKVLTF